MQSRPRGEYDELGFLDTNRHASERLGLAASTANPLLVPRDAARSALDDHDDDDDGASNEVDVEATCVAPRVLPSSPS